MNSVGIPQPPKPPFCTPPSKVGNCSQLNRRVSVGVKNGRSLKKKKIKPTRGGIRPRDFFCIFAVSAALLYANKSAAPHHMSPDRGGFWHGWGGWTKGIGLLQCAKTYLTLFVMLLDTFILK